MMDCKNTRISSVSLNYKPAYSRTYQTTLFNDIVEGVETNVAK